MKTPLFIAFFAYSTGGLANRSGEYSQCGGMVPYTDRPFTGPTECAQGFQCFCQDERWHQCRPSNDLNWPPCARSGHLATNAGNTGAGNSNTENTGTANTNSINTDVNTGSHQQSEALPKTNECLEWNGHKSWSSQLGHASTTRYDFNGNRGACGCITNEGWQTSPANRVYAAGATQSLFQHSSEYCGPGCGQCYELTNLNGMAQVKGQIKTGSCDGQGGEKIVVMILDLCPAKGNEQWCSQPKNAYGYGAHFDVLNGPWDNPVVSYRKLKSCPGQLTSHYKNSCKCAAGQQSRVRRGIADF